jgi:hypothetical protein
MRAHTVTTNARVEARGHTKRTIVPGGILALSLAVVLFAATASTASTTPTPSAPPLTLGVWFKDSYPGYNAIVLHGTVRSVLLTKKLSFKATTSNDSTLVATGDVKRTTKQLAAGNVLAAGEGTVIKARLKQSKWNQLKEEEEDAPKPVKLRAKIKLKATDEFGQTATDEYQLRFWCDSARCHQH